MKAAHPKWKQRAPPPLALVCQRALGSQIWAPRTRVSPGSRGGFRGLRRSRGPWPQAPERREEEKHPRPNKRARPPRACGGSRVGRGVRGGFVARAHRRGLPSQGRPRGWKPDRGRQHAGLPSPRPPPPPSSLLPPGERQPPPPEPRAAREMAPVWPPGPAEAKAREPAREAPGLAAPETASATTPHRGALRRAGSRGAARPSHRLLRAPNDNRGRAGGGGERPPLAAAVRPAREPAPALPSPRPPARTAALL